ncbi:glycosyltransferase family 2 protein [Winogradskyella ludwigii]|uniref:glycosyltransferase family 2 protein n=1 Tax=Winogradskyella ludwigii TaxID=2686076 RepID=UPI0015CD3449|nr:glycosyltransferase family 2 protein [Winogradskyella ludwigii]
MLEKEPLVSIIIPTFNRAHLIGETLDSVLAQTYLNWECMVVDDGSTDGTAALLERYISQDARFQYHKRPDTHLPGGNGARNYGFKVSKGKYINWFDSDDLMVPEKLQKEVMALCSTRADFSVSKSKYFNHKNNSFFNYDFRVSQVSFESFAVDYIRWITSDLVVKSDVVKDICFNETLLTGQEYNFNCKLLLKTTDLVYVEEFLTKKRFLSDSKQGKRDLDRLHHHRKLFDTHWLNYLDLKDKAKSDKFNRFSLLQCVLSYFELKQNINLPSQFIKELKDVFPKRYYYFYLAKISQKFFGRYYKFYLRLKNNEVFKTYRFSNIT